MVFWNMCIKTITDVDRGLNLLESDLCARGWERQRERLFQPEVKFIVKQQQEDKLLTTFYSCIIYFILQSVSTGTICVKQSN